MDDENKITGLAASVAAVVDSLRELGAADVLCVALDRHTGKVYVGMAPDADGAVRELLIEKLLKSVELHR